MSDRKQFAKPKIVFKLPEGVSKSDVVEVFTTSFYVTVEGYQGKINHISHSSNKPKEAIACREAKRRTGRAWVVVKEVRK